jgi:hypothetical protein
VKVRGGWEVNGGKHGQLVAGQTNPANKVFQRRIVHDVSVQANERRRMSAFQGCLLLKPHVHSGIAKKDLVNHTTRLFGKVVFEVIQLGCQPVCNQQPVGSYEANARDSLKPKLTLEPERRERAKHALGFTEDNFHYQYNDKNAETQTQDRSSVTQEGKEVGRSL